MGGKSNKKRNQNRNANKPEARDSEPEIVVDDDGKLDELPPEADEPRPHVDVDPATLAASTDKPEKTWLEHQVERMQRARQHNMLTAMVVRANFAAEKLDEKTAEKLAKDIEMHTMAAHSAIEEFLGKIPENFEGVTPSRTGIGGATRKGFLKGVKVKIKDDAKAGYELLFSPDELNDLTVEAQVGTNVSLVTKTKAKLVIPRKNIEPLPAKQAA